MLAARLGYNRNQIQSATPLSNDQLRSVAPSIFAEAAHESRSARYTYVPTIDVLNGLRSEGFEPFFAAQSRSRIPGKSEFTKHMLRLRHASQLTRSEVPEVILINSHDGTSSYQMLAGMFRFICLNGMVCGQTVEEIRVPHKGNIVHEVIEGAYTVLDEFGRVIESVDGMKSIALNPGEQHAFARAALTAKYGEPTDIRPTPVQPEQVLLPRRHDDRSSDLWTVFNRTQEHLVRGGQRTRNPITHRRGRVREITGISENVALNRALWTLAEEMAKLKTVH